MVVVAENPDGAGGSGEVFAPFEEAIFPPVG